MKTSDIYVRMNNPTVIRIYSNMIRNNDIEIVKELRKNITEQASDHPHFQKLEELFKERLGE